MFWLRVTNLVPPSGDVREGGRGRTEGARGGDDADEGVNHEFRECLTWSDRITLSPKRAGVHIGLLIPVFASVYGGTEGRPTDTVTDVTAFKVEALSDTIPQSKVHVTIKPCGCPLDLADLTIQYSDKSVAEAGCCGNGSGMVQGAGERDVDGGGCGCPIECPLLPRSVLRPVDAERSGGGGEGGGSCHEVADALQIGAGRPFLDFVASSCFHRLMYTLDDELLVVPPWLEW